MRSINLPAPAKLNLFLHILRRREDGYHDIQTVFQFINFCDEIQFSACKEKSINLKPSLIGLPREKNLIYKAAMMLKEYTSYPYGANIVFNKLIPMGSGMGGGSSDVATTLLALNYLWQTDLKINELAKIGSRIGADVAVFVHGHAAWAEGVGDLLTPMILPEPWYVVLVAKCHISTADLYNDSRLTRDSPALTIGSYRPGEGHNDFEPIVSNDYPPIAHALDWLGKFAPAHLTGSGCGVFAAFDTLTEASKIAAQVPAGYDRVVAKGLNISPLHQALAKLI